MHYSPVKTILQSKQCTYSGLCSRVNGLAILAGLTRSCNLAVQLRTQFRQAESKRHSALSSFDNLDD